MEVKSMLLILQEQNKSQNKALNKQTSNFFKFILSSLSTIASLFNLIGNQRKAEIVYCKYAQIIEKYYGNNSLESSNWFFWIGVFYISCAKSSLYEKAK